MYIKIQKRTSELLSKGNITDKPSQYVDMILFILILLNIAAVCLESVKSIGEEYKVAFNMFELISVFFFFICFSLCFDAPVSLTFALISFFPPSI